MFCLPEGCRPFLKICMCRSSADTEVHFGVKRSRNMENEKLKSAKICASALPTLKFINLER